MAQGSSLPEKIVNGCISGSLEAVGAAGLAWTGYQVARKRPLRGVLAAAAAAGAIYFNTGASQNYYAAQDAAAQNQIEASGQTAVIASEAITRLETEIAALIEQNGGSLPRPLPVIEAAYSHLDPDKNPINMARKATEEGLRMEYERLQGEIARHREGEAAATVAANDQPAPVIPKDQRLAFIWAIEAFKGGAFFLLGTDRLSKPTLKTPPPPTPPAPRKPLSPAERERRQRYAILRAKGRSNPAGPAGP